MLLFFYPFLSARHLLSFRDLSLYFYPLRSVMVEMVKSGQIPLWNPYMFCGYPLLGTLQIGLFYPLTLIHYILPFGLAFNYYTILHYFLAALFMYWLIRYFQLSRASAFFGAVVFAFSGYLLSMANMNTTLSSVIWLPLLLIFYDKYIREHKLFSKHLSLLAVCFGLQFLGGEPTIIYLSALFLAVYGMLENQNSLKRALTNLGGLVIALVLAGGLVAVQLLPFLETAFLSLRSTKADYAFISYKAFPPRELINFVLPFFFGNLLRDGSLTPVLLGDQFQAWLLSPYLGIFPLLFALFSIHKRMERKIIFFWGIILFSLFLAFGRFTPVYGFFFRFFPGIALIRYPVKYIFLAVFSLSVLAGFGYGRIEEWIDKKRKSSEGVMLWLIFLLLLTGSIYLWASANLENIFLYLKGLYPSFLDPYFRGGLWELLTFNLWSLRNLALFLLIGLILFYLAKREMFGKAIFNFLMISLVVFDLFSANSSINIPVEAKIFEQDTANIQILKKDPGFFRYFFIPSARVDLSAINRSYAENLALEKDSLAPNWLVSERIPHLGGRESMEPRDFMDLYWARHKDLALAQSKLLNAANVKYIFARQKLENPQFKLIRKRMVGDVPGYLYQNLNYYPRAYFVRSARIVKDRKRIVREMVKGSFDPRNQVILEEGVDYDWEPSLRQEKVNIIKHEPNQVVIRTFSDKPRILFLSDTFYPGWKAYEDGKQTKIFRANYMFRAVYLEAGEHELRFVYSPLSFKLGALFSLLTIILLSFVSFRYFK